MAILLPTYRENKAIFDLGNIQLGMSQFHQKESIKRKKKLQHVRIVKKLFGVIEIAKNI